MSARDDLWRIIDSDVFLSFERRSPIDADKVRAEWAGTKRPNPRSRFALGLVNLIRANPKPAPAPAPAPVSVPQPFALARNPRGGVEDIARYKAAGLKSLMLNLGDHAAAEWVTVSARCVAAGVPCGWWWHVRAHSDLSILLLASHGTPFVGINVEAELETTLTPAIIADAYRDSGTTANPVLITYGWVQNNVRFTPQDTADWVLALEVFPQPEGSDGPISDTYYPPKVTWPQCAQHARDLGHRGPIVQLAQTYGLTKPDWYTKPYSIYTLDDAQRLGIEAWL